MRNLVHRVAAAFAALVVLAACSVPAAHHVGESTAGLFFDVPRQWHNIDSLLISKAQEGWKSSEGGAAYVDSLTWQTVWTGSADVSAEQVFSNDPVEYPTVYASVRSLYDLEKQNMTGDLVADLQDIVLPVSQAADQDGLVVRRNEEISQDGLLGIVQQLSWDVQGVTQTFDVRILLGKDSSKIYTLIARCTDVCRAENADAFDSILSSFTVKEPTVG